MAYAKYGVMLDQPVMRSPVPGTNLMLEVERIIRDATWGGETPISLAEVKRRMRQKSPRHTQVRDLVDLLVYMGRISETPAGVEYSFMPADAADQLGHVPI
ncbi:MAG TPA: hypothetical protein VM327_09525 [Candidatus Thermoplasmatota archaeon]|nr:hypothetical protein [Candidatus Thermoplasmatota archaeon]